MRQYPILVDTIPKELSTMKSPLGNRSLKNFLSLCNNSQYLEIPTIPDSKLQTYISGTY